MLLDVETFRTRTQFDLARLVEDLQAETRRSTPEEAKAWRNSLPTLATVLAHRSLAALHVHVGGSSMMVEYRLPASPSWADIVLLGRGRDRPSAVILELKDWNTQGDLPGPREALVMHRGHPELHPSDQVRGYAQYCRHFHSTLQECNADVAGCVFFTYSGEVDSYRQVPHDRLVAAFPVFARNKLDMEERLPQYLGERLLSPDAEFARKFEAGTYRQDRGFVLQIAAAIKRPETIPFVLLDKQREGFELCMAVVKRQSKPARASARSDTGKSVVVIEGPPGSGKSIIAAQLWATLCEDEMIGGNIVLTTTSSAQRTNWEHLFEHAVGDQAARGVVIGANRYNPGISQQWRARSLAAGHPTTIETWRDNVDRVLAESGSTQGQEPEFAVSIVDEAHALIDPTAKGSNGMYASGWLLHAGPQAWHVIRSSRVAIFLLDPQQSYRHNETTTVERLEEFAAEFGADFTMVSLAGSQFRCGGSVEYMRWVDSALAIHAPSAAARTGSVPTAWRRTRGGPFELEVFDDPKAMEDALRRQIGSGRTARLAASYAKKWTTKRLAHPHLASAGEADFNIPFERGGVSQQWTRIWNYTGTGRDPDYSLFIQAPAGSATERDPLCEVGCPYVLRGFDFDYIGLLWLNDLVWRTDRWQVNLDHVHETGFKTVTARARMGIPGAEADVIRRLKSGYRILLSRAICGTYLWFEDEETREHIQGLL